jgi:outer membrane protein TolC
MSGGIQISQLVYNQSFLVSLQIARRMLEQSNLEIEKNKQNIVYDAAQLYYLAVLTNQQIGYLNKTLRNTDTLTEIVRVHLDHQLIKQVDYDRVNVNRTNLQSEISNLDLMLAQQINMLKYFTGISPDDSLVLITALADDNMLIPNTSYTDNQLILREIDQQKKLLNLQIDLAHSQNLPYLSAFGDFSYNSQQNDFGKLFSDKKGWLGTSVIGLSLNVPIFSGGQRYYQMKQYQVQSLQMDLNRDFAAKQIETSIRNANLKVKNLEQTIVTQQKNVTLADEVYNVIFDQYRQGYASLTDLLSAGSARITAQSAHAQSLVQLRIAWLDLLKANGNIMDIIK